MKIVAYQKKTAFYKGMYQKKTAFYKGMHLFKLRVTWYYKDINLKIFFWKRIRLMA